MAYLNSKFIVLCCCPEIKSKISEGLKKAFERVDKDTKHLDGNRAWNKVPR